MAHTSILFLAISLASIQGISNGFRISNSTCELLTVPYCQSLGYKYTEVPNVLQHSTQAEAALALGSFQPLIKFGCSPYLKEFLCSVYAPTCNSTGISSSMSCQSLCKKSFKGCSPVMTKFNFVWPYSLNCSQFSDIPGESCITQSNLTADFSNAGDDDDDGDDGSGSGLIPGPSPMTPRCERLTIQMCQGLGYTSTWVPNYFNHTSQNEAALLMSQMAAIVKLGCSVYLKKFLCSLYAPECKPNGIVPPCRSICEEPRGGCAGVMQKYGYVWPDHLKCSQFYNRRFGECIQRPTLKRGSGGGRELREMQGNITSPNFAGSYPPNSNVTWIIKLRKSKCDYIEITIDTMRLEYDQNCMYDYLVIKDELMNEVGPRHCGTYRRPYVINVQGHEAIIQFVSDKEINKKGFSLSYKGKK